LFINSHALHQLHSLLAALFIGHAHQQQPQVSSAMLTIINACLTHGPVLTIIMLARGV
jgi:hypothetical protein